MKKTIITVAALACATALYAAELEKTPLPSPTPTPAFAPATGPAGSIVEGVGARLDAAIAPDAKPEAAGEALADAETLLQGGAARPQAAAADAAGAASVTASATPGAAPARSLAPAQRGGARAATIGDAIPRPREQKKTGEGVLHMTAAIVFIAAMLIAYMFLINGLVQYTNDVELELQQQMRQGDDWSQ